MKRDFKTRVQVKQGILRSQQTVDQYFPQITNKIHIKLTQACLTTDKQRYTNKNNIKSMWINDQNRLYLVVSTWWGRIEKQSTCCVSCALLVDFDHFIQSTHIAIVLSEYLLLNKISSSSCKGIPRPKDGSFSLFMLLKEHNYEQAGLMNHLHQVDILIIKSYTEHLFGQVSKICPTLKSIELYPNLQCLATGTLCSFVWTVGLVISRLLVKVVVFK